MGKAIGGAPGSPPLRGERGAGPRGRAPDHEAGAGQGDAASTPSIGKYLARQRELRGIDLDELVAMTRIPRRSLERLEGGAFDATPDGFVRGFVRTVATAIGLDPDETVMRMLPEPASSPGRSLPSARALAALALAAFGLLLLGLALTRGMGEPAGAPSMAAPSEKARLPVRRDAVRALAEEQAQGVLTDPPPAPPPAAP